MATRESFACTIDRKHLLIADRTLCDIVVAGRCVLTKDARFTHGLVRIDSIIQERRFTARTEPGAIQHVKHFTPVFVGRTYEPTVRPRPFIVFRIVPSRIVRV